MEYRQLGTSGLIVSGVGFGCARIGGTVEWFDRTTAQRILDRAFDCGITLFDTADIYAQGNSERLLGETFRRRRTSVILATKGGYAFATRGYSLLARLKPLVRPLVGWRSLLHTAQSVRGHLMKQCFSPEHLTRAVDASLRRLRTDYIDLYQLHSPSKAVLESGEIFGTLECLKAAGKIRHFGVACLHASDALLLAPRLMVSAVQVPANLLQPEALQRIVPLLRPSTGVIARQPFAAGLLTRDPAEWASTDFGGDVQQLERTRKRVSELRALGPLPSLALRYLAQRSDLASGT